LSRRSFSHRPTICRIVDISAFRVSHSLDGLLLAAPHRFISPDKHLRFGSPRKRLHFAQQVMLHETGPITTSCRPQAIYTMRLKTALPMSARITLRCFHLRPMSNPLMGQAQPEHLPPVATPQGRAPPLTRSGLPCFASKTQLPLEPAPHIFPHRQADVGFCTLLIQLINEPIMQVPYEPYITPVGQRPSLPPASYDTFGQVSPSWNH